MSDWGSGETGDTGTEWKHARERGDTGTQRRQRHPEAAQLSWLCPQPGANMREGRITPPPTPSPGLVFQEFRLIYLEDRHPVPPASRTGSVSDASSTDSLAYLNSAEWDTSEGLPCPSSTPESSALLGHGLGWSRLSGQRASWVPGSGSGSGTGPSPTGGPWVSGLWVSGSRASSRVSPSGRGACPSPPPPSSWPAASGLPGTCSGWLGPAGSWWPPPDVTVLGLSTVKR